MILSELVNFLQEHPYVGIAGPKQYLMDKPTVIASMGGKIDWKIATIIHRFYQYDEKDKGILTLCPQRVDFQDGCAVCIRRELIDKAGLLDERYYLGGYEDAEMGIRAKRHGYEVWNVPSARMWHKVSAAAGMASPLTTYYMTRNALLFFSENSQIYPPTLAVFRILIRTIRTIGAWNLKKKYKDEGYRRKSKANLYAIRDFAYKKYGLMGSDVSNQFQ
jgi:GT2 family glycosyltransferase